MSLRILFWTLSIILLSATASISQTEKLVDEWVEKDLKATRLIPDLIEQRFTEPEAISTVLGSRAYLNPEALGFGASRFEVSQGYGYATIRVSGFTYRGKLFRYRVLFGSSLSWDKIRNIVIDSWKRDIRVPFVEKENSIYYESNDEAVLKEYKAEVEQELGALYETEISGNLKEDYEYLLSPFQNSVVGFGGCGAGGAIPGGKDSIDVLIRSGQFRLVENILKGYNPGGRVYALIELTKRKNRGAQFDEPTLNAMKTVAAMELPIQLCNGGVIEMRTAAEILRGLNLN